jgi:hypothetical protein
MRNQLPQALIPLLIGLSVFSPATARADDPAARLRARGLEPLRRAWLCGAEVRLRDQLNALDRLERPFFQAREQFHLLLARYDRYQARIKQLQELRERNRARLKQVSVLNPAQRKQLEGEGRKISESLSQAETTVREEFDKADETSPLSQAAIELSNRRTALAIALLAVRREYGETRARYEQLQKDPVVRSALEALGSGATLGPLENYQIQLPRRLDRLIEAVFTDTLPVYRRSKRYRISLIINERTPFTFSYAEEEVPTVIPASLVQLAELKPDETAAWKELRFGERVVAGREVVISQLRLGHFVLENVHAWALPPEAEDLGARVGKQTLASLHPRLDNEKLLLRLSPPKEE